MVGVGVDVLSQAEKTQLGEHQATDNGAISPMPPVKTSTSSRCSPTTSPAIALDADMSLTPAGEHSTRLSLAGVYRPPLAALGAGLDRAVFHKVADATVRSLLARVADVLGPPPEPAGAVRGTGRTGAATRRAVAEMP